MLVYMCACRLRLCVRSGLRLRLTHHLSRPPPHHHALPGRMPPVRWWFLAPGQDARASAGPLSAVDWRGLALLALLGPDCGWGAFGSPGPGPVRPGMVGCRWSLRACRHGTLGRLHCGCRRSRLGLSSALFWVEAAVVPAVVLLGVPCPGGLWMLGPGSFPCLLHALREGCCSPHTLLNIYMEEPYEHKRAHTHRCTLKHSHWCKNRCSQTHCLDLLLLQNLFCNISYVCCSITFNIRIYCDLYRCWLLLQSFDVVFGCFLFVSRYRSKLFFFFFVFFFGFFWGFFFFSLPLSLYPPFSFFLSSLPLLCWLSPQPFFLFFYFSFLLSSFSLLFSLSPGLVCHSVVK